MSLKKWFNEKWVDIGSPKKVEDTKNVEENLQVDQKESTPNACLLQKAARMTDSEKRSAVARKRASCNPGGKPTNVSTFTKKYYGGMIEI